MAGKLDRRWRHPWQVVRIFTDGALTVHCSHRFEVTAGWCSDLRDWAALFVNDRDFYHDERRTPGAPDV